MPLIEKRYAEALIKISAEQNSIDKIQDELNKVNELIESDAELKKFINNPTINSNDKKAVIEKIFNKQLDKDAISFLKLLIDKSRIKNLSGIVSEYTALADEMRNCLNVEVTTAVDIDKVQLSEIGQKFKKKYNSKDVKVKHIIDPSIIGGVIVKIGDKMVDSSIKGRLDGMLETLAMNN